MNDELNYQNPEIHVVNLELEGAILLMSGEDSNLDFED